MVAADNSKRDMAAFVDSLIQDILMTFNTNAIFKCYINQIMIFDSVWCSVFLNAFGIKLCQ